MQANKPEQIIEYINNQLNAAAYPLIIAIDGRSGAGKSTLATILAQYLDALIIKGDDFYNGGTGLKTEPPSQLAEICIDWQAQKEVLLSLRASSHASYFPFDWDAFDGSKKGEKTIKSQPIILLEGVYSARPELSNFVDITIFVGSPKDIRHSRLLKREGKISEWELQWHRAEDWYFKNTAPIENFDIIYLNH